MGQITYKHERVWDFGDNGHSLNAKGGSTLAVEEIQLWAFNEYKPGTFFEKKIGIAKCHPDENFCKKTGRAEAEKKMKTRKFTVVSVSETLYFRRIHFAVEGIGDIVMVRFANSKRVRIV